MRFWFRKPGRSTQARGGDPGARPPGWSHPSLGPPAVSNAGRIAWVAGRTAAGFEVRLLSPLPGDPAEASFEFARGDYPPECVFVGETRLLVVSRSLHQFEHYVVALVDTRTGRTRAESELRVRSLGSFSAHGPSARAAASQGEGVVIIDVSGDRLEPNSIECASIEAGPLFAPDGALYFLSRSSLHRIEGRTARRLMDGRNCVCINASGDVFCGGGFRDRSGSSTMTHFSPRDGRVRSHARGRMPVDAIDVAGADRLLVSTRAGCGEPGRVSLHALPDLDEVWGMEVSATTLGLPVLLAIPEEGWALLQGPGALRAIQCATGRTIWTLPRPAQTSAHAAWVAPSRSLALASLPRPRADLTEEVPAGTLQLLPVEPLALSGGATPDPDPVELHRQEILAQIRIGMDYADVVRLLGEPSSISGGSRMISGSGFATASAATRSALGRMSFGCWRRPEATYYLNFSDGRLKSIHDIDYSVFT